MKSDQQIFDQEVANRGKLVLEVLAGLGIFAALIMSMIALTRSTEAGSGQSGSSAGAVMKAGGGSMMAAGGGAAAAPVAAVASGPPKVVELKVVAEGKKGPEGKMHDDFSVTEFSVTVGRPVTLRIDNTDEATHSISAPEAGVNIVVKPGTHDYTLLVNKAGRFEWDCMYPCDPWSMQHVGYMRGFITASSS